MQSRKRTTRMNDVRTISMKESSVTANSIRRRLLQAMASASALAVTTDAAAAAAPSANVLSIDSFARISATLTGYPAADPTVAAKVLKALGTPARRAALAKLASVVVATPEPQLEAALRAEGLDIVANEVVSAWYSGVVTNANGPQLVLYIDAYVWTAMTWSKPMGVCGGAMGYWSSPPQ